MNNKPLLKGFDITDKESEVYRTNYIDFFKTHNLDKPIVPIIDIYAPAYCNYLCPYCFTCAEAKTSDELNEDEIARIFFSAKKIGVKTIGLTGLGEPTIWKKIRYLVELANAHGFVTVIYTNNSVLAKNDDLLNFFFEHNVSLLLKYNSINPETHNYLCGNKDAYHHREILVKKIFDIGYNKSIPPRIGIESVICELNKNEIKDMWHFARTNNIIPYFEIVGEGGRSASFKSLIIPTSEMRNIFNEMAEFDFINYGYKWNAQLPYLANTCMLSNHLLIDEKANVLPCFNLPVQGNIKNDDLISILKKSILLYTIREQSQLKKQMLTCDYFLDGNE
ncbi:MAG: radical SAM protein [Desulfamplus sp.]|nr:radical SAM protein [Desulfamplus sp.]